MPPYFLTVRFPLTIVGGGWEKSKDRSVHEDRAHVFYQTNTRIVAERLVDAFRPSQLNAASWDPDATWAERFVILDGNSPSGVPFAIFGIVDGAELSLTRRVLYHRAVSCLETAELSSTDLDLKQPNDRRRALLLAQHERARQLEPLIREELKTGSANVGIGEARPAAGGRSQQGDEPQRAAAGQAGQGDKDGNGRGIYLWWTWGTDYPSEPTADLDKRFYFYRVASEEVAAQICMAFNREHADEIRFGHTPCTALDVDERARADDSIAEYRRGEGTGEDAHFFGRARGWEIHPPADTRSEPCDGGSTALLQPETHHVEVVPRPSEDQVAAAKWADKCLKELAAYFCSKLCSGCRPSDLVFRENLSPEEEIAIEEPEVVQETDRIREEWNRLQSQLHEAFAYLEPFRNWAAGCPACLVVDGLRQFPIIAGHSPSQPVATVTYYYGCDGLPGFDSADPKYNVPESFPCCEFENCGEGEGLHHWSRLREEALSQIDLSRLPPMPPPILDTIRPVVAKAQAVLKVVASLMKPEDQSSGAKPPADDTLSDVDARLDAGLAVLLMVLEKYRLIFLCVARPVLPHGVDRTSETLSDRLDSHYEYPLDKIPSEDMDYDNQWLFRYRHVFNRYVEDAMSTFGPGKGEPGEDGHYPRWKLEELLVHVLEESSDSVLHACKTVVAADPDGVLQNLVEEVMGSIHDEGQCRWLSCVLVRWEYLGKLDECIAAAKAAGLVVAGKKKPDNRSESVADGQRSPAASEGKASRSEDEIRKLIGGTLPTAIISMLAARDLARMARLYPDSLDQQEVQSLREQLANVLETILKEPGYEQFLAEYRQPTLAAAGSEDHLAMMLSLLLMWHPNVKSGSRQDIESSIDMAVKECQKTALEPCQTILKRITEMQITDCRLPHPKGDSTYEEPRRFLQMATEYWGIGRQIVLQEMDVLANYQPHPLQLLIVNLRLRLDECLQKLIEIEGVSEAKEKIDTLLDIVTSGEPDALQAVPEWTTGEIGFVDKFLEALRLRLGSRSYPLTDAETAFLKVALRNAHDHNESLKELRTRFLKNAEALAAKERARQQQLNSSETSLAQPAARAGTRGVPQTSDPLNDACDDATSACEITVSAAERISGVNRGTIQRAARAGQIKNNGKAKRAFRLDSADFTRWLLARGGRTNVTESELEVERKFKKLRPGNAQQR